MPSSQLCTVCSGFSVWESDFKFSGRVRNFRDGSSTCELCRLLLKVSEKIGLAGNELELERDGTIIRATGHDKQPILSLFSDPGNTDDVEFAQVGYPTLFAPNSCQQIELFKEWLHVCDTGHGHRMSTDTGSLQMPTRLISLAGTKERVVVTNTPVRYLAFSHCWGTGPTLRTLTSNLDAFRKEIPYDLLPLNFQQAIKVTRALGISYLWIDSLCIVQDDTEDWKREAARMGQVFSNAYCTIAATSAASSDQGFLSRQTDPSSFVSMRTPSGGLLHIGEFMENYHQDLEMAPLNTRGWVLQERALSPRTLHFTKTQVYWECGDGVKCERLFKLSNPRAALFTDSDFPKSILRYYKGGRNALFQTLYLMYTRRVLSQPSDRSIAIQGLEKRLMDVLETNGGFGILTKYLARSLLWRRPEFEILNPIPSKHDIAIPSWSWMAYLGPITYMEIPLNKVEWMDECVFEPNYYTADKSKRPFLKATARDLTLGHLDLLHRVVFDQTQTSTTDLLGVVLGRDKQRDEPIHYVLVIRRCEDQIDGGDVYLRVGVAWLREGNIANEGKGVKVH